MPRWLLVILILFVGFLLLTMAAFITFYNASFDAQGRHGACL